MFGASIFLQDFYFKFLYHISNFSYKAVYFSNFLILLLFKSIYTALKRSNIFLLLYILNFDKKVSRNYRYNKLYQCS